MLEAVKLQKAMGHGTWDIESSIYRRGCDLIVRHVLTEKLCILLFVCCFDHFIAFVPISQLESPIKMYVIHFELFDKSQQE